MQKLFVRIKYDKFEFSIVIARPINFSGVVKTAIIYRVGCATSSLSCTNISRIPDRIYKREEDRPLNAIGFPGVGHYRLLHLSNTHKASESQPPKDNKGGIDGHATINMRLFHDLSVDLPSLRQDWRFNIHNNSTIFSSK